MSQENQKQLIASFNECKNSPSKKSEVFLVSPERSPIPLDPNQHGRIIKNMTQSEISPSKMSPTRVIDSSIQQKQSPSHYESISAPSSNKRSGTKSKLDILLDNQFSPAPQVNPVNLKDKIRLRSQFQELAAEQLRIQQDISSLLLHEQSSLTEVKEKKQSYISSEKSKVYHIKKKESPQKSVFYIVSS